MSRARAVCGSWIVATLTGMISFSDLDTLPGADLVKQGAEDLDGGHESVEALLVSIGAHSAYNALLRRLVSFERAAACAS
jgi:hypothetical protein